MSKESRGSGHGRPGEPGRDLPATPMAPRRRRAAALLCGVAILLTALGLLLPGCSQSGDDGSKAGTPEPTFGPDREKPWTPRADGERMFALLKELVGLGPRPPGSETLKLYRSVLKRKLFDAGVTDVRSLPFAASTPDGPISMENIVAVIPGEAPEAIWFSCHYESKKPVPGRPEEGGCEAPFVGANDGGSGAVALIELARHFAAEAKAGTRRPFTLVFAFFDGEEAIQSWYEDGPDEPDHTYGSRRIAETPPVPVKALINLDMVADRNFGLARDTGSTDWLQRIFENTSYRIFGWSVFTSGRSVVQDDHQPFIAKGIPAIDLIDFEYPDESNRFWHTVHDTVENCSARSLERIATLVIEALPDIELRLRTG